MTFDLNDIGLSSAAATDVWTGESLGIINGMYVDSFSSAPVQICIKSYRHKQIYDQRLRAWIHRPQAHRLHRLRSPRLHVLSRRQLHQCSLRRHRYSDREWHRFRRRVYRRGQFEFTHADWHRWRYGREQADLSGLYQRRRHTKQYGLFELQECLGKYQWW